MKKSLLFSGLLFSAWSFAIVNFVSGDFPILKTSEIKEFTGTTAKEAKTTKSEHILTANGSQHNHADVDFAATWSVTPYPVAKGSEWYYLDNGTSLDEVNWTETAYDVQEWASGFATLGYGDPMTTNVSFGPDASNKYITTYYVKDIEVNLTEVADFVEFGLRRDDGALVYVNGTEVFRSNMPEGEIDYLTHSASIIDGADEKRFYTYRLPKTIFQEGINRIAVEIHNRDGQSSDTSFDLYIKDAPEEVECNEPHIACFSSIVPTSQSNMMQIPQEHRFQLLFKQGEQYTDGSGTVPGNHDYTAYVGAEGSSETGYLAINHENTPGGVSVLNVHLDTDNHLWVMDESKPVDFYNDDLVTTVRNCSGGVTPWGTVITAEESLNSGDVNGDGYEDVGWLVELDPVTGEVVEYGNGKQEKLWAMGRMNHENVVVTEDGTTAYYGEDGGTHCLYKFVADTPGNLYEGTVYVLKMDLELSSDEPSSSTATWVEVPNDTQADRNNIRNVAAALGGTNFNGVEDCEISPIDGKVYFTSKGKNRVYSFKDDGATVSGFETFVGGMSYPIETPQGTFTTPWGNGNDNLTFDDKGNLWVLQDGSNNQIWVVAPDHTQSSPKVSLFATMPAGSEPTGLTFTPDFKYGFFSVQHPSGSNSPQMDATSQMVTFDASATVVFALREDLGMQAPITDFVADQLVLPEGESVTFTDMSTNNPTTWAWTFEGGTPETSNEENPVVTYEEAGTYTVSLVTTNPAGESEETKVDYIVVEEVLGLEDPLADLGVSIYPNPTQGIVTIALNDEGGKNINIEVYDIVGRKVTEQTAVTTGNNQNIVMDLSAISGEQVFIIKLHVGDKTGTYKLVKSN